MVTYPSSLAETTGTKDERKFAIFFMLNSIRKTSYINRSNRYILKSDNLCFIFSLVDNFHFKNAHIKILLGKNLVVLNKKYRMDQ